MQQNMQQALQLYQRGYREQAHQLCQSILSDYPGNSDALLLMGLLEKDRGELERARQCFQKGLKRAPRNVHLLNNLGSVENMLNDPAKAEVHFRQALKIDPHFFQARHNLANLLESRQKFSEAKRLYREVIKQQPRFADAFANLSSILEKQNQLDEARSFAEQALAINPGHFIARLTLANVAINDKAYQDVIGLLTPALETQRLSPVNRAVAAGKCAYAYEMMKDHGAAFALYRQANQVLYQAYETEMQNSNSPYAPGAVKCVEQAIPNFDFTPQTEMTPSPVFLVGFPRSGTTLLDQVLSSHSQVRVIEEKQNLIDTHLRFPSTEQGLAELAGAGEPVLRKLRQQYWRHVDRETHAGKAVSNVVDKLPLNAVALLHIHKLFPRAKIVVALRDPRDSVMSCYQQRFGMNPAMFQMLDLDTAVSYYDQVMKVIAGVRDTGAFPMHFVRYEQVVQNYADEVKALTDFLGLEWEPGLLDYQGTAKARYISTPSAFQVTQPLYTSSIGKWRHYLEWIGTSLEPLEKWVDEWGYRQ